MKIIDNVNVKVNVNQPSLKTSVDIPDVNIKAKVQVPTVEYENDYDKLENIPTINGVEVKGNKTIEDFEVHTSELINDGDGQSPFATEDYVEENGGKIDKIFLNDVEQEIINKEVKLIVNKNTIGLSNEFDEINDELDNINRDLENEIERSTLADNEINTKLQQEMDTRVQEHAEIQEDINEINSKIPNQASSTNQLADKAFVNSSINANAATFKGNFATKAALDAVQWQTTNPALATYVTNNDYAYVESDETHNGEAWRYIYIHDNSTSEWQPQFKVNDSPFTQAQLDAINSGATADLIASIADKLTVEDIVDSTGDSSIKAISQRAATLGINTVQSNLNTHITNKNNPHQVTKAQIGLGNVNNTADLDKPISTAVQNEFNRLYPAINFAEMERQKSKNLFNENLYLSYYCTYANDVWTTSSSGNYNLSIFTNQGGYSSDRDISKLPYLKKGTYTITFYNATDNTSSSVDTFTLANYNSNGIFISQLGQLKIKNGVSDSKTFTLEEDSYLDIRRQHNTGTISFNHVQIEEGSVATDYQPYNGPITHNGDAPVVFAEAERQKSKNLFNINKLTLLQGGTVSNNQINLTQYYALSSNNFTDLVNLKSNTNYVFSCKSTATEPASTQIAISSSLETVYWYENTSKSFTQEEINAMTTFYIYGNRDNSASVISEIQIEEGAEATEYQPYNGAIVHKEQLKDYLPLSGGTMTGPLRFADGNVALPDVDKMDFIVGLASYAEGGNLQYMNTPAFKSQLLETNGAIIKGRVYGSGDDEGVVIGYANNGYAGLMLGGASGRRSCLYLKDGASGTSAPFWRYVDANDNASKIDHPCKDGTIALAEDCLPVTGGTLNGALLFPTTATYSNVSQPTALSYGRLQAYGTLNINGNTDNSGTEYVNITAGHGCSSSTADGLSIGTDTLTWKNQDVIHTGNLQAYTLPTKTATISSKYVRFCQLDATTGSGYSAATFLIAGGGDFGGAYAGVYLVTLGTRNNSAGTMKITTLQNPTVPGAFKFGYYINSDNDSVDYFVYGATYNFSPIYITCLSSYGTDLNTSIVEISEPSSYTTAASNGDIVTGSINSDSITANSVTASGISISNNIIKDAASATGIKLERNNELNFNSISNYIYFGYRKVGDNAVNTYKFMSSDGSGKATGTIECGTINLLV